MIAAALALVLALSPVAAGAARNGQHNFDFLFGSWKVQHHRLKHALSDSHDWYQFDGTSNVRAIWNGRALVEDIYLDVAPEPFYGLAFFIYDVGLAQYHRFLGPPGG